MLSAGPAIGYNVRNDAAGASHNPRAGVVIQKLAILVVVGAALAVGGCKRPMTDFTSAEFKFKAKFPGTPKTEDQTSAGIKIKMFAVETRNGMCGIAVSDAPIPPDAPAATIQNALDGARDGAIKGVGGTSKSSAPVTLGGKYPGREFSATVTQPTSGLMRARVYLVGPRLYQVMAVGTESYVNSAEVNEFMNSFQLLE